MSNPTRLRMVELLRRRPCHVNEIAEKLGLEQSLVSHNLRCLLDCGFVSAQWNNGNKVYSIEEDVLEILKLMDKHIRKYEQHLRACGVLKEGGERK